MKVKLQIILTLYDLYHVHTKINIPSHNNEDQCPREQHPFTVISLLMKRAAVILVKQHGQMQCTMDGYC
jgi:hypothetical protein